MSERRDEDIQLDLDKNADGINKKLKESEDKLNQADQAAQAQIQRVKQLAQFQGSAIEIAQQNSLVVLAGQYFAAAFLSMLIVQLGPVGQLLTWIPFLDRLCILIYVILLLVIQFCPSQFENSPMNFIVFLLHSITKILLLVFTTLWWESLRCELYQLLFALIIVYILSSIKTAIINKEDINLSVKSNFIKLLLFAAIGAAVLSLLTRQNLFLMVVLAAVGLGYSYYLMLALQRYPDHQFLTMNSNDFYIGAAQLDSDLFLCCKLVGFHCFSRDKTEAQALPEDEKDQI